MPRRNVPITEESIFIPEPLRRPAPTDITEVEALLSRWRLLLEYDPVTGDLLWRYLADQPWLNRVAAKRFGPKGVGRSVQIDGFRITAARLVWLLHKGVWPVGKVKRRNGENQDDRIENLYETLGKGFSGIARSGFRWQAYARSYGSQTNLGVYDTEAEAQAARQRYDADGTRNVRVRAPNGIRRVHGLWVAYHQGDGRRLGVFGTMEEALVAQKLAICDIADLV